MTSRIVVFAVTGVQGGSVARALLADEGKFEVIGITRNITSVSSQALEKLGVKLVEGDLTNPSSYESALKDVDGMFYNANFFANYTNNAAEARDIEITQGKAAVDAAKRAGVKFIVYSALKAVPRPVPHFDSKVAIAAYIKESGIPATMIYTSYYYTNLFWSKVTQLLPGTKSEKTIIDIPMPDDTAVAAFNPEQTGLWARVAFRAPETWAGREIEAVGENITVGDVAKEISKATGRNWETKHITLEEFMGKKGEVDPELWLNYLAIVNGEIERDVVESHRLVPEAENFAAWLRNSAEAKEKWGVE